MDNRSQYLGNTGSAKVGGMSFKLKSGKVGKRIQTVICHLYDLYPVQDIIFYL